MRYHVCIDDCISIIGLDRDQAESEAIAACYEYPGQSVHVKTWIEKNGDEVYLTPSGELVPEPYDWNK